MLRANLFRNVPVRDHRHPARNGTWIPLEEWAEMEPKRPDPNRVQNQQRPRPAKPSRGGVRKAGRKENPEEADTPAGQAQGAGPKERSRGRGRGRDKSRQASSGNGPGGAEAPANSREPERRVPGRKEPLAAG